MLDKEEKEYLEKNSKFYLGKEVLSSMELDDMKDFISPLYTEYSDLKHSIEKRVILQQEKYKNLSKLEKYFIELQVSMVHWWDTLEILKETLQVVNNHLYSRLPKVSTNNNYKQVDINQISICDVIWKYMNIPSNYERRNIKCPLHNDKTASFKVYKDTNSFYCFWCHSWWNAINFISEIENISTKEAYKRFIEMFNYN